MMDEVKPFMSVRVLYTLPGGAPGGPGVRYAFGGLIDNTHDTIVLAQQQDVTLSATYGNLLIPWDFIDSAMEMTEDSAITRPPEETEDA